MNRERNLLDKILGILPGFTGYTERESRRRDDARIRDRVVSTLRKCEVRVDDRIRLAFRSGNMDQTEALERCRKEIDTLLNRVLYSPVGTSPFMSDKRLSEIEQQQILTSDISLLDGSAMLEEKVNEFYAQDLLSIIQRLSEDADERNIILRELK